MTQDQYRKKWLRLHKKYEKYSYKMLMHAFRNMGNSVPYDKMQPNTYEFVIESNITERDLYKAYLDIYTKVGIKHGTLVGDNINTQLKAFELGIFEQEYNRTLINWIAENVGVSIRTVRGEFVKYIKEIVTVGIQEGKGMLEIAREIKTLVNSNGFYRWQALRIARTETTSAANHGATISASTSRVLLEKIWISALDARTRRPPKSKHFNHYVMNGVTVDKLEAFDVQGERIQYPGAKLTESKAPSSPGNVINCRCGVGYRAKRDSNGRIIRS